MAEGDFWPRRFEVESQDEIGVLTDTFNDMARQLQDTLQEVENERTKLDTLFLHMTDGVVAFNQRRRRSSTPTPPPRRCWARPSRWAER